ncbi:MAG TPA: hypothetical protein VGB51_04880 [Actinomycetota bacterium]
MPRRHRSARDRQPPEPIRPPSGIAPGWAQVHGFTVHVSSLERDYVCPGCNQLVRGGEHLVVYPDDEPDLRRHWHSECWRRELKRGGP